MATGVKRHPEHSGNPGLADFGGTLLHSSQYRDGDDFADKRAIVVGTGNSGHDIAQDLCSSGASVTLVQRSSTLVVNIEPSAQLAYTLYDEGPPLDDCDLIATSMPFALVAQEPHRAHRKGPRARQASARRLDAARFQARFRRGRSGWQFKYLTRGGGYYSMSAAPT